MQAGAEKLGVIEASYASAIIGVLSPVSSHCLYSVCHRTGRFLRTNQTFAGNRPSSQAWCPGTLGSRGQFSVRRQRAKKPPEEVLWGIVSHPKYKYKRDHELAPVTLLQSPKPHFRRFSGSGQVPRSRNAVQALAAWRGLLFPPPPIGADVLRADCSSASITGRWRGAIALAEGKTPAQR